MKREFCLSFFVYPYSWRADPFAVSQHYSIISTVRPTHGKQAGCGARRIPLADNEGGARAKASQIVRRKRPGSYHRPECAPPSTWRTWAACVRWRTAWTMSATCATFPMGERLAASACVAPTALVAGRFGFPALAGVACVTHAKKLTKRDAPFHRPSVASAVISPCQLAE